MMKKLLIAGLFVFAHSTYFTNAQGAENNVMDVCASAPEDLLVALEGRWNLRQGQGKVLSAVGMMPLPARGGHTLILKYDQSRGALIGSDEEGGEMVMTAVTGEGVDFPDDSIRVAESLFDDDMLKQQDPANCDFYSLPLIFGTNIYDHHTPRRMEDSLALLSKLLNDPRYDNWDEERLVAAFAFYCLPRLNDQWRQSQQQAQREAYERGETYETRTDGDRMCRMWVDAEEGELVRTLLLRFSSPENGSGMLYFALNVDGNEAWAAIPVTISR